MATEAGRARLNELLATWDCRPEVRCPLAITATSAWPPEMVPVSLLTPFSYLSSCNRLLTSLCIFPGSCLSLDPPLQLGDLKLIGLNQSLAALSLPTLLSLESNLLNESSVFSLALPYPSSSHSAQVKPSPLTSSIHVHVCPCFPLSQLGSFNISSPLLGLTTFCSSVGISSHHSKFSSWLLLKVLLHWIHTAPLLPVWYCWLPSVLITYFLH